MAHTTVELGHLVKRTNFKLFDFPYQVDDPNFKKDLEQKILDYFYFYEIGSSTPDRFKHRFKTRFLRAIGYYNKLYNTTLLSYNPLINYKMAEALEQLANTEGTQDGTTRTNGSSTAGSTSTTDSIGSDYPQQAIAGGDYRSDAQKTDSTSDTSTKDNSDTTSTGKSTNKHTTSYEKKVEALTGTTYQELIRQERENIIRIPNMIIEELKPCFILVH